jgi:hypothetical protein
MNFLTERSLGLTTRWELIPIYKRGMDHNFELSSWDFRAGGLPL